MSDPAVHAQEHQDLMEFSRKRRALMWVWLALTITFVIGALVFINLTVARNAKRIDFTRGQWYTLHNSTKETLAKIPESATVDIYVTYLVSMTGYGEDLALPVAYDLLKKLLEEFSQANPRIQVHFIERETDQAVTEIRAAFKEEPAANMVYLVAKGAEQPVRQAFPIASMYRGDPNTGTVQVFFGESRMASAIVQATDTRRSNVYVTTGHRELQFSRPDPVGLTTLARLLDSWANASIKELDLSKADQVPDDCDVLLIPGLGTDFNVAELKILENYLNRGGDVFVSLSRDQNAGRGIATLLEKWGARINSDTVIDPPSMRFEGDALAIPVRTFGDHEINQGMTNVGFRMLHTRSVEAIRGPNCDAVELMFGPPTSWSQPLTRARAEKTDQDREAPPLAVAAMTRVEGRKLARVVAWGSGLSLANANLMMGSELREDRAGYVLNTFRWLLEKEGQIVAPPKQVERRPLELKAEQANLMFVVTVIIMPLVGVVLGTIAWFFRRK